EAHWVTTECRPVRARPPAHHAFSCDDCAERHAARDALGRAKNVRLDSGVLTGSRLSCAAHSRLHFVHDEHDSVLAADPLQFMEEELGRRNISTFALNGLDDDARDVFGIEQPFEDLPFELFENFRTTGFRSVAVWATISVGVGNVL